MSKSQICSENEIIAIISEVTVTFANSLSSRLAPVLKINFHLCVISITCSQSISDGSVLKLHTL